MTQNTFAKGFGITRAAYAKYEEGHSMPSLDFIYKIGIHFGLSIDDMYLCNMETIYNSDTQETQRQEKINKEQLNIFRHKDTCGKSNYDVIHFLESLNSYRSEQTGIDLALHWMDDLGLVSVATRKDHSVRLRDNYRVLFESCGNVAYLCYQNRMTFRIAGPLKQRFKSIKWNNVAAFKIDRVH